MSMEEDPADQIRNLRPGSGRGSTLDFPPTGKLVRMQVTCTAPATPLNKPSNAQKEKCLEVIGDLDTDCLSHIRQKSQYAETGDDKRWDVRLDNEGVIKKKDDKVFAMMRIQANDRSKTSPTFAVLLAETSDKPGGDGPFFGRDRLRAALQASVEHKGTVKFREIKI